MPERSIFAELAWEKPKARLADLDAARGLAILLVVIGHVVARDMPADNAWYDHLKDTIYLFHMPLFMALAGISFALSLPRFPGWGELGRFSAKRVERLFVPYVAFGVLVIGGKLAAGRFLHVDNPPDHEALLALFVMPTRSGATFLWFIYVLSIYLVLVPALFQVAGRRPLLLLALGVALGFLGPWPELFMLDEVVEYLPFFAAGMLLWQHRGFWKNLPSAGLWGASFLFAALLVMAQWLELPKWLVGAASLVPVLGWMHRLEESGAAAGALNVLAALGRASLAIYLMNTIAIGLAKGLMLKLLPWDGVNFLLYFPVLASAGVALPMLVRAAVTRHAPRAARYVA